MSKVGWVECDPEAEAMKGLLAECAGGAAPAANDFLGGMERVS